jgi:hypothetical protein
VRVHDVCADPLGVSAQGSGRVDQVLRKSLNLDKSIKLAVGDILVNVESRREVVLEHRSRLHVLIQGCDDTAAPRVDDVKNAH